MKRTSLILWIITIIFTIVMAYFQRRTGPTKPVRGTVKIEETTISYRLIRSATSGKDAEIKICTKGTGINGFYVYRRYLSYDNWTIEPLKNVNDTLIAAIPDQPPAGKVMYQIVLEDDGHEYKLTEEPVIMRYKGHVPAIYLVPHILFMFIAMLYSNRAGLQAFYDKAKLFRLSFITFLSLVLGGLIFGPIVQLYAFGDLWTGFPLGHDLTDNKTAVAVIFWGVALYKSYRGTPKARWWVLTAAVVLLLTYLIPHSVMGSEIDFRNEINGSY